MKKKSYGVSYYSWRKCPAIESAEVIVPYIIENLNPTSVVDLGCAEGAWLSVFSDNKIQDIHGFDGPWGCKSQLMIPEDKFTNIDFEDFSTIPDRVFDLAISLEVAEHITQQNASDFVSKLTKLSNTILFSAAVPGQGGLHHYNEQPPAYWQEKFEKLGFKQLDTIRPHFWNDSRVAWWYRQNMFFYIKENQNTGYISQSTSFSFGGSQVIHPQAFQDKIKELSLNNTSCKKLAKAFLQRICKKLLPNMSAKS
jgi:hypothetical protein